MGQVLIVRHGQADTVGDDYDRLVERGFAQCRALGASLATRGVTVDRVVRGGMRRHRESAEALIEGMGSAPEVGVDRGWDEFDHLAVLAREPYSGPPPTGRVFQQWFEAAVLRWTSGADANYPETFIEFTQRVGGALQRAAESDGTTMVVTSGGAIGWVAAQLTGSDFGAERQAALWRTFNMVCANSGLTRVVSGRRGLSLVSFNEQAHLDGTDLLTYR